MSMRSDIASVQSREKAKATQTVMLAWIAGILAVATILTLLAGGHVDPAYFTISPDAGGLPLP